MKRKHKLLENDKMKYIQREIIIEELKMKKVIKELDDFIKSNPDSRELKRTLAVKLALQGWKYSMIATTLNVSKSFITKWKNFFNESGIEGIKLSYQGSQSYLSIEEKVICNCLAAKTRILGPVGARMLFN